MSLKKQIQITGNNLILSALKDHRKAVLNVVKHLSQLRLRNTAALSVERKASTPKGKINSSNKNRPTKSSGIVKKSV